MIASLNNKKIGDLHVKKESHMASPMKDQEWHMKAGELNMKCIPGKPYTLNVAVICTSADEDGERFRQIAKYFVTKGTPMDNKYDTNGGKS